jgi:hypothetical protein
MQLQRRLRSQSLFHTSRGVEQNLRSSTRFPSPLGESGFPLRSWERAARAQHRGTQRRSEAHSRPVLPDASSANQCWTPTAGARRKHTSGSTMTSSLYTVAQKLVMNCVRGTITNTARHDQTRHRSRHPPVLAVHRSVHSPARSPRKGTDWLLCMGGQQNRPPRVHVQERGRIRCSTPLEVWNSRSSRPTHHSDQFSTRMDRRGRVETAPANAPCMLSVPKFVSADSPSLAIVRLFRPRSTFSARIAR